MGNGLNTPALLFGIILLVASIGLFFWGRLKPELARDSDNIYSVIGIICSIILFTSAFDLSLILGFQQLLLIGSVIVLMWENIQKRTPNPDAKRSFSDNRREEFRGGRTPYRADRVAEYDEFSSAPRSGAGLRGSDYDYGGGRPGYEERSLPRRDDRLRDSGDRTRRDRPNRSSRFDDNYGAPRRDEGFGEPPQITDRASRPRRDQPNFDRPGPRMEDERPRRRNSEDAPRRRPDRVEDVNSNVTEEIPAADYVDFTPIESTDSAAASNGWGPQN